MPRRRTLASAVLAGVLALSAGVAAADPVDQPGKTIPVPTPTEPLPPNETGRWLVELESQPTISGGRPGEIRGEQKEFETTLEREDIDADVTRHYDTLFNGMTVQADGAAATEIAALPQVKSVTPVRAVKISPRKKERTRVMEASTFTGVTQAREQLGLTGKGIKVGIIDTGIDYDHPALGGTGKNGGPFPTARVTTGWDYVGDTYQPLRNEENYQPVRKPDGKPDDCEGHGTHVAGIVGANDPTLKGVAPDVTFGAYRVLNCDGFGHSDDVLAAMERARKDGMHVVNLSLGWDGAAWPQDPISSAANRLADAGVVVVVAAGNAGPGHFTTGSPAMGAKVISVSSYENIAFRAEELLIDDGPDETFSMGYTPVPGSASPVSLGTLALMSMGGGCNPSNRDLTGKIAVAAGFCPVQRLAANAQSMGASGLIVVQPEDGTHEFDDDVEDPAALKDITIPAVVVDAAPGRRLFRTLTDDDVVPTATFTGNFISQPLPGGGLTSEFTSFGLAADLSLKPDLGAPGGQILSTLPLERKGSGTFSGTSMAAPHVAGIAALMLQAEPKLKPAEVRNRLMNSAVPTKLSFIEEMGVLDPAHRQGAGMVQAMRALTGKLGVTPASFSTGESDNGPHTQTLTLTNRGTEPVTYTVRHEDAMSTSEADGQVEFTQLVAQVKLSATSITVPAGGGAQVSVTVSPDRQADKGTIHSGYIHFEASDPSQSLSVPYAGMVGDYGALAMLNPEGSPDVAQVDCALYDDGLCLVPELVEPIEEGHIFKMGKDLPHVGISLSIPVLKLEIFALQVDGNGKVVEKSKRLARSQDYVGRDNALWVWDGKVKGPKGMEEVRPGSYVLRVVVHSPDRNGRTETWTSPIFGVKQLTPRGNAKPTPKPTAKPTPKPTPSKPAPPVLVAPYEVPGMHHINGRKWFTTCEKYGRTQRCRTEIWANHVVYEKGKYQRREGWVFNNLSYLPFLTREEWGTNPLARNGAWTSAEGRKFRTECDTPATGKGACRTYIHGTVIRAEKKPGGGWNYRQERDWVFNNQVRFKR